MVREGRKHSESVRRGSSIGHECRNMRPEPGVAHHRASAFAAHHNLVMDLGRSHNWDVAMDYDVQQQEVVSLNLLHNLSTLNIAALTIIATHPVVHSLSLPSSSSPKRSLPADSLSNSPKKHQCSHCFRCGGPDHFPADCKADLTTSGRPVA